MSAKRAFAIVAITGIAFTLCACGVASGKPKIHLSPHPKQKYEITVTIFGAPGAFDSESAYASYETDTNCVPIQPILGGEPDRPGFDEPVTLTRVSDNTYTGYVYLDLLQDADYFDLGVCHWSLMSVNLRFVAHGLTFGTGLVLNDIKSGGSATEYFSKNAFYDTSLNDSKVGALGFFVSNDGKNNFAAQPDKFFSMVTAAKRVGP